MQDDGVIKSKSEQTLSFKPVALAIDPTGKWIAASSSIVGTQSSITIFKQNNDGTLTPVHTFEVRGKPFVALSYDPTGNWLVAASIAGLSLYAQANNGSLKKMDSDITDVAGHSLKYNPAGDAIASTADLRSTVVILAQDKAELQEKGELRSSRGLFTDVCFASDGTLFVAEVSDSRDTTTLKQYRIDQSTGSFELVGSFPIQAEVTSLAPHPNLNMLAVAIDRAILLFEWDSTGNLRIKKEYPRGELGQGKLKVQYDESGKWLGVLNTDTGDFVLFKQDGTRLKQVDTYAFNLKYTNFGFFYPRALKKAFVAEGIAQDIPEALKKLIATFVEGN